MSEATPEPTPEPTPTPEPAPAGWRDGLEPDVRDHPALAKYEDVPALARGHLEAQKLIGTKGIIKPGADATPEQMGAYYTALGRPETADGYELGNFQPPEAIAEVWDAEGAAKMVEKMHARGLPKDMAQGVLSDWADHQAETLGGQLTEARTGKANLEKSLHTEWGLAYEGKLDLAKRSMGEAAAAAGVTPEELLTITLPNGGLVGNSPVLTKIFALLGEGGAELTFVGGGKGGRVTLTPEEADTEIAKLQAHEAYTDGRHPEHKAVIEKLAALNEQKYPDLKGKSA